MYGLTSTLSMAANALNAENAAIAVTSNNVSNVNTPGYTRQVVNLSPNVLNGLGIAQDNGVSLGGYTSVRDQVLQLAINQKTSVAGSLNAQSTLWSQVSSGFSGTTTGLGSAVSNLFSSLSALSTTPTDSATRQQAFAAAGQLTNAFHQSASVLAEAGASASNVVTATVTQVNDLSRQIAGFDQQLSLLQGSGQDGGTLEDERDQLTTQLSGLVGLSSINTESTPTLALSDGTPLVIGGTASALTTGPGADGATHIYNASGADIGAQITGGSLGGALQMQDQDIPSLQSTLNTFAAQFATSMNAAQQQGFDSTGAQGQPMFLFASSDAAATLSLTLSSGSGIAASSDGSAGSSGNMSTLLAVQGNKLPGGQTPTDTYAGFVQAVGNSASTITSQLTATNTALGQLTTTQSSESGVSVDEETTNLLRYQQAYSAAAQVISTINNLFSAVLNMGAGTA